MSEPQTEFERLGAELAALWKLDDQCEAPSMNQGAVRWTLPWTRR
jgi:hypothetical protein